MSGIHSNIRGRPEASRRRRRGLVLVASVGVLGVISVMGLAFATVMRLEARAARNYTEAVRAEFVARAGIEDAIGRLRVMAREGAEAAFKDGVPADWYTWRGTAGGAYKVSFGAMKGSNWLDDDEDGSIDGDDTDADDNEKGECGYTDGLGENSFYTLRVEDAASKINVNVGDNLGTILDNLCRVIGPPLRAADQRALVPKWFSDIGIYRSYGSGNRNIDDRIGVYDLFYRLGPDERPICESISGAGYGNFQAIYGDGYAIAGWRSRHGEFTSLEDVRNALTWIERGDGDGDGDDPDNDGQVEPEPDMPEEQLEIEAKFAALKPYITIDSWSDTDQVGYGKFEQVRIAGGKAIELTDRNACWNIKRNPQSAGWIPTTNDVDGQPYAGELQGCYVAIINGVGQGQIKTIAANTADTIILSDSYRDGSEMRVPPNQHSSYIIIGKDGFTNTNWREQLKLYARQPLSFHRSPVNINTASDKVLTALLMGLQTDWGLPGYYMQGIPDDQTGIITRGGQHYFADALWQCPSIVAIGRDNCNAFLTFNVPCPNDSLFEYRDPSQDLHGHPGGAAPYCFFCSFGRLRDVTLRSSRLTYVPTYVNEAHYLAWQILKEREQTEALDLARIDPDTKMCMANGYGSFRGWDDVFYRVFYPHERALKLELHYETTTWVRKPKFVTGAASIAAAQNLQTNSHPGIARLCMANFNSNTGLLKFQPNLEYIDRWGPNFTDLYLPRPDLMKKQWDPLTQTGSDVKLRIRPGELLDKSDLNVGTTEFCFDSAGVYDIQSVGRVYDRSKSVTAERKLRALVKIYDVWRESTQREFVCGEISTAGQADPANTLRKVPNSSNEQRVGSVAVDKFAADEDTGAITTGPAERKALTTLPEALAPKSMVLGHGIYTKTAALALGATSGFGEYVPRHLDPDTGALVDGPGVQPAGYDGQIVLATNQFVTGADAAAAVGGLDNTEDLYMFIGFTGGGAADYARGNPLPQIQEDEGTGVKYFPLDLVSVLGIVNDELFDVKPSYNEAGMCIEGEGRGGDLRPDGMYLGVVGQEVLDGSFEYLTEQNFKHLDSDVYSEQTTDSWLTEGTYCMWIKPSWHHGTVMPASLPIDYDPWAAGFVEANHAAVDGDLQRGCHVLMRNYAIDKTGNRALSSSWDSLFQRGDTGSTKYTTGIAYDAIGYVRDRFEHELFSATAPVANNQTWGSHAFRFDKAGDCFNSNTDLDSKIGMNCEDGNLYNGLGLQEFGGLHMGFEYEFDGHEVETWLPGMLSPTHASGDGPPLLNPGRPYYQMCPFRWFFIGATWNYYAEPRPTINIDCTPVGTPSTDYVVGDHEKHGQPREYEVWHGNPDGTDKNREEITVAHMGAVLLARGFVDTMRTWKRAEEISFVADDPNRYDLEDWAYEQYGSMYHADFYPLKSPIVNDVWGVNRAGGRSNAWDDAGGGSMYQRHFSGTYATVDDIRIHGWKNAADRDQYLWPQTTRERIGRYHLPIDPSGSTGSIPGQIAREKEPSFTSQSLYMSESRQNHTFEIGEDEAEIEVCTVRWTAFTPYFCVDKVDSAAWMESNNEWRFHYDWYFRDPYGTSRFVATKRNSASPAQVRLFWKTGQGKLAQIPSQTIRDDISTYGVASRMSSQRGCKVKVQARNSTGGLTWFPEEKGLFYEYPEGGYEDAAVGCTEDGWQQILVDPATGEHPKCQPRDVKYKVFFRLSMKEYTEGLQNAGAVLLDTPVFDDITITYMRRPKVLEWRDVSE